MIYVLLQAPNDGYYVVCKAATDKHFAFEDAGYTEIKAGLYHDMLDLQRQYEAIADDIILLYCDKTKSIIQTTDECLIAILDANPNYLNDKEFVYDN